MTFMTFTTPDAAPGSEKSAARARYDTVIRPALLTLSLVVAICFVLRLARRHPRRLCPPAGRRRPSPR